MEFNITVPNIHFDGVRVGVKFKAGRAVVEDSKVAERLKAKGYLVEAVEAKPEPEKAPEVIAPVEEVPKEKAPVKKAPAKKKSTKKADA